MMKHASLLMIAALCGGFAVASAQDAEVENEDGTELPHQIVLNGNMGSLMLNYGGSFLGIVGDEVNDEIVQKLNLPGEYGAIINEVVKESAAEKAGLQKEDVIVGYNGTRVESMAQLRRMIAETPVGRSVDLTIIRNGAEQRIKTELGTRTMDGLRMLNLPGKFQFGFDSLYQVLPPDFDERMKEQMERLEERLKEFDGMDFSDADVRFFAAPEGNAFWFGRPEGPDGEAHDNPPAFARPRVYTRMLLSDGRRLGATVQGLSPQLARFFKLQEGESGALVSEVHEGRAAEKGGLQAGDVIVSVDGEAVKNPMDLTRLISTKEGTVELRVIRDGNEKTFRVDLGEKDQGFQWYQEDGRNDFFKAPESDVDLSFYGR